MEDLIGLILTFGGIALFLALGYFVGGWTERKHFASLTEREQAHANVLVSQIKTFPGATADGPAPTVLFGEAVIASDYLKTFLAGLRNIFGGEVKSYQTLLDRARRESLQRILEQAQQQGYNAVCNVRFENADVGGNTATKKGAVMAAILASATAYHHSA